MVEDLSQYQPVVFLGSVGISDEISFVWYSSELSNVLLVASVVFDDFPRVVFIFYFLGKPLTTQSSRWSSSLWYRIWSYGQASRCFLSLKRSDRLHRQSLSQSQLCTRRKCFQTSSCLRRQGCSIRRSWQLQMGSCWGPYTQRRWIQWCYRLFRIHFRDGRWYPIFRYQKI